MRAILIINDKTTKQEGVLMNSSMSEGLSDLYPNMEIPVEINKKLKEILAPQEEVRISVSSDMNMDGAFEDCWLLATDKRLFVFSSNHSKKPELLHEVSISDITEVTLKNFTGNGFLEVETNNESIELLRFSKTALYTNNISNLPQAIDHLREQNGQIIENKHKSDYKQSHRCEKCGNIIPFRRDTCPNCLKKRALLLRLFSYLKPYWSLVVVSFILSLLMIGLDLATTYMVQPLTDRVFAPTEPTPIERRFYLLNIFVIALIGMHVLRTVLGTGRTYLMSWLGNKVILNLRTTSYEYLQMLSMSFYDKKETGRLMTRITNDTGRLNDFIVNGIQDFIIDVLMVLGMSVILFTRNWQLAAWTLIPIPILTFAFYIFGKKMHSAYHKEYSRLADISAILADTIPGVKVVKTFVSEDREIKRFNLVNDEYFKFSMYAAKISTIYFPIVGFATFSGGIVIRWLGGRDVIMGDMTLGALMLFMSYMFQFYNHVNGFTRLNHMLQRAAASADRVFEILDAQPEINDKKDAVELPEINGYIKFNNVSFSYDGEQNAIDDVSFEVKAGQMIGLSGPSGAGKTTVINLINRFYDATEGSVTVDGHDVRDVKVRSLRDQIGIVLQEPFLFHGSIAENIAYSKPEATRAEVISSAKASNAHDFIMGFPEGYDTMIGERGSGLSGGEKQRISIARAILKNPRILVLDEATSSVDTETESLIQSAIERLVEGRTTFAIAHRLSTLKKADKLIILEKGKVTEMGTHNELLEKNGLYKRLVDMQSELSKVRVL